MNCPYQSNERSKVPFGICKGGSLQKQIGTKRRKAMKDKEEEEEEDAISTA